MKLSILSLSINNILLTTSIFTSYQAIANQTMIELPTIEVRAATDQVTGGYTEKTSRTATKLDLSLKETPQSAKKFQEYIFSIYPK